MERNTVLTDDLQRAEGLLLQGEYELAQELLARRASDAEAYVDANCPTTSDQQFFSFPTPFDYLAYVRVEKDPRTLYDVGEPLDRLYADLGRADVLTSDYQGALEALRQAVRWNPMDCASRLNLADLYHAADNDQEYLALNYSVFERASRPEHLVRAFLCFSNYFQKQGKDQASASALRAARNFQVSDSSLEAALDLAKGTPRDPDSVNDQEAADFLSAEGLPYGANAEIAICLLQCALDEAQQGNKPEAAEFTVRARDLIGEPAAMALLKALREVDEDDPSNQQAANGKGEDGANQKDGAQPGGEARDA